MLDDTVVNYLVIVLLTLIISLIVVYHLPTQVKHCILTRQTDGLLLRLVQRS